jgi:hypothetical protein
MIQNSLKVIEKFQRESATLEKKINDLTCGLSDIAARLNPSLFALARQTELEQELETIIKKIIEIKKGVNAADQQVSLRVPLERAALSWVFHLYQILLVAKKLRAAEIGDGIAQAVIPRFGLTLLVRYIFNS